MFNKKQTEKLKEEVVFNKKQIEELKDRFDSLEFFILSQQKYKVGDIVKYEVTDYDYDNHPSVKVNSIIRIGQITDMSLKYGNIVCVIGNERGIKFKDIKEKCKCKE